MAGLVIHTEQVYQMNAVEFMNWWSYFVEKDREEENRYKQ